MDFKFSELTVYKKAFYVAMEIFEMTKSFPDIEKYGLISQIRISLRSVCANIAEGYRKRQYEAHFVSKTSDADMENSETAVWVDFAYACGYIRTHDKGRLIGEISEIGKLINHMINNPDKYKRKEKLVE